VLRHVTIAELNEREAIAFSSSPVPKDQVMSLYVNELDRDRCLTVSVIDSRPVMRNGVVFYELRLAIHDGAQPSTSSQETVN
jgi:hypothetical protein